MVMQSNGKKQPVWQDITPVKTRPIITATTAPQEKKKLLKKIKLPKPPRRLAFIIILFVALIIAFIAIYYFFFINRTNSVSTNDAQTIVSNSETQSSTKVSDIGQANPKFSTILPAGKTISSLGGWTLISPSDTAPVYTYTDQVTGIGVNVSEQELPDNFKEDTDQKIENLALSFNASQKISVNELVVYIGTSTNGPQSIIFCKNDLLILIKSDAAISNDQWVSYINSLQ